MLAPSSVEYLHIHFAVAGLCRESAKSLVSLRILAADVSSRHIVSFRCPAELCRYRAIADIAHRTGWRRLVRRSSKSEGGSRKPATSENDGPRFVNLYGEHDPSCREMAGYAVGFSPSYGPRLMLVGCQVCGPDPRVTGSDSFQCPCLRAV